MRNSRRKIHKSNLRELSEKAKQKNRETDSTMATNDDEAGSDGSGGGEVEKRSKNQMKCMSIGFSMVDARSPSSTRIENIYANACVYVRMPNVCIRDVCTGTGKWENSYQQTSAHENRITYGT